MRHAGDRIEAYLGDGPDYGEIVSDASTLRSRESQAITDLMGNTAKAGLEAAGLVEGAKLTGRANATLARAEGTASMLNTLGEVGGSFMTAGIDRGLFKNQYNSRGEPI